MTHIPTNCGAVNDLEGVGRVIEEFSSGRRRKVTYIVDACQSLGQRRGDVEKLKCDVLAATGRKYLRGPRGTGFLYVRLDLADRLVPSHIDHFGAPITGVPELMDAGAVRYEYKKGARRFEFWERSVANLLGLGAAVDHAIGVGIEAVEIRCKELALVLSKSLKEQLGDNVKVYCDPEGQMDHCGIVSFSIDELEPSAVKMYLLEKGGITSSVVPKTSTPLNSASTECKDLVRVSVSYFNTEKEIETMCKVLKTM